MNAKTVSTSLIILAIVAVAWFFTGSGAAAKAPDITFKTLKGESISLHALKGKPTLITFWATDCPGCIREIPHLKALHRDYEKKGVNIIAVAMPYDRPDNVIAMAEAKALPYNIALDPMGEATKAFGQVRLTPTSFIVAPDLSISFHKIGEFSETDVRQRLDDMLKVDA